MNRKFKSCLITGIAGSAGSYLAEYILKNGNKKVIQLAKDVMKIIGSDVKLKLVPTDDNRSYHISSEKIKKVLGFEPKFNIEDAIVDLKNAFEQGLLPNSLNDEKYFNIKRMQSIKLV